MHTAGTELSVVMPALNEEKNIAKALAACLQAFDEFRIDGEIVVVNDGSSDATEGIVAQWRQRDPRIRMIAHERPQGIGASFWDGVAASRGRSVVMLPGDNENSPREIFRYHSLLDHVDIVIPFVFNKDVRSLFRNAFSFVYRFIINTTFGVYFNYTNGTNLYRRSLLRQLSYRSDGFFFQTDILIRLVKKGYLFAEVPYRLGVRKDGVSRASSFPSFVQVVRGYIRLVNDMYFDENRAASSLYMHDSATKTRRHAAPVSAERPLPSPDLALAADK
mgnify:CR=1 FL=1